MNSLHDRSGSTRRSRQRWISVVLSISMACPIVLDTRTSHAFGPTGHRVVGRIAESHLTPAAARAVKELLGTETLARVGTWADEIRSDPKWKHASPWHYVTIEDGETYASSKKNPRGDAIEAVKRFVATLRSPSATKQEKTIALKWIVHLIGDLHQPLHVGRGKDRGGNTIQTKWFGESVKLHAVWDSKLIDSTELSFSELAEFINKPTDKQVKTWQDSEVLDWVQESIDYREQVYTVPGDSTNDSYKYAYKNLPLVKLRLTQAGVRLAGVLNSVFADQ